MNALSLAAAAALCHPLLAGPADTPPVNPDAIIDLATARGVELVRGSWRIADANIVPTVHTKADGTRHQTFDLSPRAGGADFDDAKWTVLSPEQLHARQGKGRLSFEWYRMSITVPEQVGTFPTTGSTILLDVTVDDYAEIWVDGKLPLPLGQRGAGLVSGFNAPNRIVLAQNAKPGQQIQVAILAANGPLSAPPDNQIWIRSATLDLYRPDRLSTILPAKLEIDRRDPALDAILSPGATLEQVASGFQFTEGPIWIPAAVAGAGAQPIDHGYLLFSDPNANTIFRWDPTSIGSGISVFREKSGYTGENIAEYKQPGSNGLTIDSQGRLTVCEHGNRRVVRIEKNGDVTVLADRFEGKRLNSPNDLVYRSDGALFFTDPPFGLPKFHDDPRRELPHAGVYCLINGNLKLVSTDFTGPNGIALSPDEKYLYVGDWDDHKKVVNRYEIAADGSLSAGKAFCDLTAQQSEDAIDGVKTDTVGNVYISGPGGLWIVAPDGKVLGVLKTPNHAHNFTWGDADGRTLYLTARDTVYRLRLMVPGVRPKL